MTIRIDANRAVVQFPIATQATRPAASADQAEARKAIADQNHVAARHPIKDSAAAAGIAALLRNAIATNAGAALKAHDTLDPRRVAALLD